MEFNIPEINRALKDNIRLLENKAGSGVRSNRPALEKMMTSHFNQLQASNTRNSKKRNNSDTVGKGSSGNHNDSGFQVLYSS